MTIIMEKKTNLYLDGKSSNFIFQCPWADNWS